MKKSAKQEPNLEGRRGFLKALAVGGAAAAAALGANRAGAAAIEEIQPEQPKAKQGYRLTQHIQDYYNRAG
jgi:F0F1-type ATP synthase membrane subunit c/vacuolar-type H+-ATPase subunit K